MTTLDDLVLDALATFRLTKLLVADEALATPRAAVIRWAARPARDGRPSHPKVGYFATCPWCVSMYVAVAVAVLRRRTPRPWNVVGAVFATSAVAGALADVVG